jgi:hypothetical protein
VIHDDKICPNEVQYKEGWKRLISHQKICQLNPEHLVETDLGWMKKINYMPNKKLHPVA